MKLTGRLRHANCPNVDETADFPRFVNFQCTACGVDIGGMEAVPTYEKDDGIYYSVLLNGHYIEVMKG